MPLLDSDASPSITPSPLSFCRPKFELLSPIPDHDSIRTLPELLSFNARHNGDLLFGLQAVKNIDDAPVRITYAQMQRAVERCMAWLAVNLEGLKRPEIVDGKVVKTRAVGLLLASDIGVMIYLIALLALGVPVVTLSARLTPLAIAHLLKATSAGSLVVSARVSRAANEALSTLTDEEKPNVYEPLSYERFLDESDSLGLVDAESPAPYTEVDENDRNVLILHSSGTTGLPKPIYQPHKYLLVYANNHLFTDDEPPSGVNVSTLPLFHGFGLLAPCLSLSVGLPFILPSATTIPTATSTLSLLRISNAKSIMTVPSILEDLLHLPCNAGIEALLPLEFVAVGGGPTKPSVGAALVAAGVKLLNHCGATEIGPIAPIFRPYPEYDWRYLQLRSDIGLRLEKVSENGQGSDGKELFQLIGHPFGWGVDFAVQDLLECNPRHPTTQFKILGRADDLLVLATGEKVLPRMLETTVANDPKVKEAIAFGDSRFEIGLVVEAVEGSVDPKDPEQVSAYIDSIWPSVEEGNKFTDNHGKISSKAMIVVTTPSYRALARTDKGSVSRKTIVRDFEQEIEEVYRRAETSSVDELPADVEGLKAWLRKTVGKSLNIPDGEWPGDGEDFFEFGMDSLQATVLRRRLVAALQKSKTLNAEIEADFIFSHPTVESMAEALTSGNNGAHSLSRGEKMYAAVERYLSDLHLYPEDTKKETVVLLTGSTGSLGSWLLYHLSQLPEVKRIICLNRQTDSSSNGLHLRQLKANARSGITIPEESWSKITLLPATLSAPHLGLSATDYTSIVSSVTHVIHNAWPMDFNRSLASFEPHFVALANLITLCISTPHPTPTRLLFTSSIAVVGRYPSLHPNRTIPEESMLDPAVTDHFGYPEAKWVCEQILEAAAGRHGKLEASIIRIGQLTGSEAGNGYWSTSEHFPSIVRSSQTIGALPQVEGTFSWLPVDRASRAIIDFAFSPQLSLHYHLENPIRQSWSQLLLLLAKELKLPQKLMPFQGWLEKVKERGEEEKNPAGKLVKFLEEEFIGMASGIVALDTTRSRRVSRTLRGTRDVGREGVGNSLWFLSIWSRIAAIELIAALESETVVLKLETVVLKFETAVLKFETAVLKFETAVLKFETAVLKLETAVLKLETAVLKLETVVLKSETIVALNLKASMFGSLWMESSIEKGKQI
ncbi:putative NRPS-like protein biosynthetic cluster [Rhizina undulata]